MSVSRDGERHRAKGGSPEPASPATAVSDEVQGRQRVLYDRIVDEYQAAEEDVYSRRYFRVFMQEPLLGNLPLAGKDVLDAACGSEGITPYLLLRGARVTGLDISPREIELYQRRFPDCRAVCGSVLDTGFEDRSFDCVVMSGALHHLHPDVQPALDEVCRVLRPDGMLFFIDPHSGSLPDVFRKLWYRYDRRYFEANEASIDLEALLQANGGRLRLEYLRYGGGVAYLPVLQPLFLRIPNRWKRFYAPPLLRIERALLPLQSRRLSFFVLCRLRKIEHAVDPGRHEDAAAP
ncbi:MAG: class I SAM-dependent methyltransferase [Actinomycetes bacterium]